MDSEEKESKDDSIIEEVNSDTNESVDKDPLALEDASNSNEGNSNESVSVDQPSDVAEEDCQMEVNKNNEKEVYKQSNIKENIVIDEVITKPSSEESTPSNTKDVTAFRMQMGREDIEKMIREGTLEKVSEGYYKMKAESLKDLNLKVSGMPLPVEVGDTKTVPKQGPSYKKLKTVNDATFASTLTKTVVSSRGNTNFAQNMTQIPSTSFVQPTPSYIALMPVNQPTVSNNNPGSGTLLALPMQQNLPSMSFNPNLPTFVAVPSQSINTTQVTPPSIVSTLSSAPRVTVNSSKETLTSQMHEPIAEVLPMSEPSTSTPIRTLRHKTSVQEFATEPTNVEIPGVRRKPQFESTTVQQPYKFAKPVHKKRKRMHKNKNSVSDLNSSDEEDDADVKSKVNGMDLASMFFKKIGEPTKQNKTLLDRLHKAIFDESHSESDHESDESSLEEEIASQLVNDESNYRVVNCPGPDIYETFVGAGQNSKLSIIRSTETKLIKNFLYEVYKVRVTSAGREANTNILIPVPEGHRFHNPPNLREEPVEFSHVAHDDKSYANYVHPKFLEKLAETQLKLRKYKDEIKVLRKRYLELLQEYANRPQFSTLSDLVGASAKFLTEDQLVFYLMQLKAGAHNMQGIRYSVREKVLALSIYQKSPEVYKWFQKMFNLPSKRVLDQWLEDVGNQDPQMLKKLMYHVYTTYNYKAKVD